MSSTELGRPIIALFAVACGLSVACVTFAEPLLDSIADEFGISHAAAGTVTTVTQLGYGLGLILLVPLGDLVDRRRLIVTHTVLAAAALLAVAGARSAAILYAAFAAAGLLAVVTQILVAHAALLAAPAQRGRVVGLVTSGVITGILLARAISGGLADLLGWRAVYFCASAAMLAVGMLLLAFVPPGPRIAARLTYPQLLRSLATLFFDVPILRVRAILAGLIFASNTILWTPLVLPLTREPFLLTRTEVGLFGLAGVAGAVGATVAGRLADRGFVQHITAAGLLLMILAWLPIALMHASLWFLALGALAISFGLQAVHVSNQSLIYMTRPDARSRLVAGYMVFYSIGSALGAAASTLVYARSGWSGVCLAGCATSVVATGFWWLTRKAAPDTPGDGARS
ncbi:MFS transporter [Roseomonas eburnea]|uniref:MFS transporter n=1 Tax=Neoroseomonas eburnea TaxID=1346889 RepID=A0A9X9XJH8_9PROT|nr:MFS transporter [Neoroseomonas eburnea]MBR0683864.1 MFS transporter [Neoroseomonas eburnea]